jgi:hypothetical protein
MKIRQVGAELFRADRQMGRHDEANSRFSQLWEKRLLEWHILRIESDKPFLYNRLQREIETLGPSIKKKKYIFAVEWAKTSINPFQWGTLRSNCFAGTQFWNHCSTDLWEQLVPASRSTLFTVRKRPTANTNFPRLAPFPTSDTSTLWLLLWVKPKTF